MAPVRRAGQGRGRDGTSLIWTVAEGRRGRRWREVRVSGSVMISSLLLETDADGRFSYLEASTAAGLITLHPEAGTELHGNVVTSAGVEPIAGLPWSPAGIVLLDGSAIAQAAAAFGLRDRIKPGSAGSDPGLLVTLALSIEPAPIEVERIDEFRWRFGNGEPLEMDTDGLPILVEGETMPLELD
jgi:hypothetical protein